MFVLPCCPSRSARSGKTWCLAVSKATISPCCCSTLTPVGRRCYCRRSPTPVPAPTCSRSSSTAAPRLVTTAKTRVQQRSHTLLQIRSDYSVFINGGTQGHSFNALTFNPIIRLLLLHGAKPELSRLQTYKDAELKSLLLSLSGREPSISSDTRTDSSTDSSSHRASRSRSLHQSTGSHLSSESQTTVVCNCDTGTSPHGSDTGGNVVFKSRCKDVLRSEAAPL